MTDTLAITFCILALAACFAVMKFARRKPKTREWTCPTAYTTGGCGIHLNDYSLDYKHNGPGKEDSQ